MNTNQFTDKVVTSFGFTVVEIYSWMYSSLISCPVCRLSFILNEARIVFGEILDIEYPVLWKVAFDISILLRLPLPTEDMESQLINSLHNFVSRLFTVLLSSHYFNPLRFFPSLVVITPHSHFDYRTLSVVVRYVIEVLIKFSHSTIVALSFDATSYCSTLRCLFWTNY